MSDTMLLGVLRMPFDLAMATLTAQIQYHQRGVQAADEIEKLRAEVERLREVIRTIRARCVELDDSDAVSETLDITSAVLEDRP